MEATGDGLDDLAGYVATEDFALGHRFPQGIEPRYV